MGKTGGSVRALWIALVALLLAALAVLLIPDSPARRTARLDLSAGGFRETFLAFSRSEPERCRVVDRRDSTVRRDDEGEPGRNWDCLRIPRDAALADTGAFMVQSKKKGRGTVFFVRVDRVPDWTYPYFYRFVRERNTQLALPVVEWTQLYVDRVYRGLHLRVALPFDLRRKDGGSGTLRELLVTWNGQVSALDTRFQESQVLLTRRGEGADREASAPELLWLASMGPAEGVSVLLSNEPPYSASLLPLPVSLAALFVTLHGDPPASVATEPFMTLLSRLVTGTTPTPTAPLDPAELDALVAGFDDYVAALNAAMRVSAQLDRSLERLSALQAERQAAAQRLGLRLAAL